jgi:hypothetical protein
MPVAIPWACSGLKADVLARFGVRDDGRSSLDAGDWEVAPPSSEAALSIKARGLTCSGDIAPPLAPISPPLSLRERLVQHKTDAPNGRDREDGIKFRQ